MTIIGVFILKYDVVHLVRLYKPNVGGMERIVENIALIQKERGLKVLIITSDYNCKMQPTDIIDDIDEYSPDQYFSDVNILSLDDCRLYENFLKNKCLELSKKYPLLSSKI